MNILRKLEILIFVLGSVSVAQADPVAGQVYEYDGHYYAWIDSYVSWDDALAYAEGYSDEISGLTLEDWHLATITSAAENDFIWNTVLDRTTSMGEVWLGGVVTNISIGDFEWVTGEAFTYSNFAPGQPDLVRETVLEMGGLFGGPLWNDEDRPVGASAPQTFLIEHGPVFRPVTIDIKPGSDPNCLNINGHGVIPVAVLSDATFDAADIDIETLSFGGLDVRVRGNKGPLCSLEDVSGDGLNDLVCQFQDNPDYWDVGEDEATLTGALLDGTEIEGTDSICIVP